MECSNPSLFSVGTRAPLVVACPRENKGVVGGDARDDLAAFWLRKTKKPVLAVLLVQKKGGQPYLYRGTNMEVRTPWLCSNHYPPAYVITCLSRLVDSAKYRTKCVRLTSLDRAGCSTDLRPPPPRHGLL